MAPRRPAPVPPHRSTARSGAGDGRRPARRRPRRRAVLGWVLGLVAAGAVLGVGGFAAAYALVDVPDPNELADAQTSTVYFADGTTELGTFAARNRENVALDQVPDHVQKAVLAAEDRTFYENRGVSPTGIARALWTNVSDGTTQGGSTLTQQYVKNYYLTDKQSYTRKFEEFFISLKIDQQQSKDETLQNYLNTVYFGRGAYGIQAAAQAYFGVDAAQLDVSQGALLAAVLKGPSNYDPRKGEEQAAAAKARVEYVLDGMVSEGWLSPADRARAGLPETIEQQPNNQWKGPNGYLLKTVEDELTGKVGLSEEDIERGGLKIVTTFDPKAQAAAVQAVQEQLPSRLPEGFHAALSAIDPETGGVTAMYGGADYLANQFNDVTKARAQPGSTFKPFALVAGLEDGLSLRTTFNGANGQTVDGNEFDNYGDESYGRIDLVTATQKSVNTVYAQLNEEVTPAKTRDVAVAAGYPQDTPGLEGDQYISNVLGTSAPHPIDVTQAYATFAAQGKRTDWHTIATIDDSTGARTYTASPTTQQAFPSDVAADATYALQQVVKSGTGSYAGSRLGRPAAGKTGTTNRNLAAWFAGYTPDLAASVALFQTSADGKSNVPLDLGGREVTGGSYPVRIWTAFMRAALEGTPKTDFPDRANVGTSRGSSSDSSTSTSTSTSTQAPTPSDTPTETATQSPTDAPTDSPTGDPTQPGGPSDGATTGPTSGAGSGRPTESGRPSATATGGDGGTGGEAQGRDQARADASPDPAAATAGGAAGGAAGAAAAG